MCPEGRLKIPRRASQRNSHLKSEMKHQRETARNATILYNNKIIKIALCNTCMYGRDNFFFSGHNTTMREKGINYYEFTKMRNNIK